MALISIIIPVYNVEDFLPDCLDSVMAQVQGESEIILVNDCSSDRSGALCEAYSRDHPAIKTVHLSVNSGVSAARNRGLAAAGGDYVLFLDSDDRILEGGLDGLCRKIRQQPDVDIVITRFISENGELSNDYLFDTDVMQAGTAEALLSHMNKVNYHPEQCWHYAINAQFLKKYNLHFIDSKIAEDQEFVAIMLCRANRVAYLDQEYYWYRERDGSLKKSYGLPATTALLRIAGSLRRFAIENHLTGRKSDFITLRIKHALSLFSARLTTHPAEQIMSLSSDVAEEDFKEISVYFEKLDMDRLVSEIGVGGALVSYKQALARQTVASVASAPYRETYLYCAGPTGMAVLQSLRDENVPVAGILDDNASLEDRQIQGVAVTTPWIFQQKSAEALSRIQVIVCHPRDQVYHLLRDRLTAMGLGAAQITHWRY